MTGNNKLWVSLILLTAWGVSVVIAFWWFQGRLIQPFADDLSLYVPLAQQQQQLPQPAPGRITVVQFVDDDCFCSRVNREHRQRIRQAYPGEVAFYEVHADRPLPAELTPLMRQTPAISRVPAALVLDQQGTLEYFGPYSFGAGCFTGEGTFVERAIDRVVHKRSQPQINVLGKGCFCDWEYNA